MSEGLIVIKTLNLSMAKNSKTGFETFNMTINMIFDFLNPFAVQGMFAARKKSQD